MKRIGLNPLVHQSHTYGQNIVTRDLYLSISLVPKDATENFEHLYDMNCIFNNNLHLQKLFFPIFFSISEQPYLWLLIRFKSFNFYFILLLIEGEASIAHNAILLVLKVLQSCNSF
jgi:hypothetical protein